MSLPVKILPQGSMIAERRLSPNLIERTDSSQITSEPETTRTSEFIRSPPKVRPPLLFTDMFTTMPEFEIAGQSGATVKSSPIKPDLRPFKSTTTILPTPIKPLRTRF